MDVEKKEPGAVALEIDPVIKDLGGFSVRRALPAPGKKMVGPFIFWDHFGPATFPAGEGIDVRPHPHIGISTITWLFEGAIRHQDSLGSDLVIHPGEINWMTTGSGIVHSERSPDPERQVESPFSGIQSWVALPVENEEVDPAFYHYEADKVPVLEEEGLRIAMICGSCWGLTSPVIVQSETLYAEIRLSAGISLEIPDAAEERALYVCQGEVSLGDSSFGTGKMLVLEPGSTPTIVAKENTLVMLLGGAALDGDRHLYWNFVSSSKERIEQAKDDWRENRFAKVPGDDEFIPLPD